MQKKTAKNLAGWPHKILSASEHRSSVPALSDSQGGAKLDIEQVKLRTSNSWVYSNYLQESVYPFIFVTYHDKTVQYVISKLPTRALHVLVQSTSGLCHENALK